MAPGEGTAGSRSYAEALRQMSVRYEHLVRDISILHEIDGLDDGDLDLSVICTRLVETIAAGLGVENCSLTMLDDAGEFLELRAASSPFEDRGRYFGSGEWQGRRFRSTEGVMGQVVQSAEPVRVDDVTQRPDFVHIKNSPVEVRSLMCFPICLHGIPIGALNLSHSIPSYFSLENEKTLSLVAERAGRLLASHTLRNQLRDSEQHYRYLMENAADAILVFDVNGRALSANPAVQGITGVSPQAYTNGDTLWFDGVYSEDRARFLSHRAAVLESRASRASEYRYLDVKGTLHFLEERCSAMHDASGTCVGVIAVIRDETERTRTEQALLASESRFHDLVETLQDWIWEVDSNNVCTYVSSRTLDILGYRPDEMLGKMPFEFMTADEAARVSAIFTRLVASRAPIEALETTCLHRDGHEVVLETSARPYFGPDGAFLGYRGVHRDISERKRAQKEHQLLVTAIEQAAESIVITDTKGVIGYVNPAFERTTGYSREDALGQKTSLLKSGRHDADFYQRIWEKITRGEVWSGRLTNKKKDGALYEEELTISPVRDTLGTITNYVAVKRDVTQMIALENQLRQSQKMEAIGQLAGGVAHDFNNLLQAIQGYSQLALDSLKRDGESHAFLDQVLDATERASSLTRQLLAFSRRDSLQRKDINLNIVISDMLKMVQRVIGEQIELQFIAAADLKTVFADAGQIGQVLINLCVNARDAMPDGGRIVIETRNLTVDSTYVDSHRWANPGQYVYVSVSDTGVGMTSETQARVFEPFFTTKEAGKGTGMGLATVYGIIKQHEGMISVYSELGSGSTFKFYLPAVERAPMPQGSQASSEPPQGGNETILLAEDDEIVRNLAMRVLETAGYRVIAAKDGAEAVALFEEHASEIDLALLDVVMPQMSGRVVSERVRQRRPDLPVLFSSGYSIGVIDAAFISRLGAFTIQKPYSPADLLRTIRKALTTHAH